MTEPLVVVAPHPKVRRWKGGEPNGVKEWPIVPLSEALSTVYETDAMMASYWVPNKDRMPLLTKKAVGIIDSLRMDILTFDVDPDKGEKPEAFKKRVFPLIDDLNFDEGLGWWETMRGYRVIVWLEKSLKPEEYESAWYGWSGWLLEQGVAVDHSARDFTRLMRLPQVHRKDDKANVVLSGAWGLPEERKKVIWGSGPERVGSGMGLQPLAARELFAGKDRNAGLFKVLGAFHRLGLSDKAKLVALRQIDRDICVPPIQETDPGELEGMLEKIRGYPLGDIADLIGDRPGTDMELDLGSQSEVGDWVLRQLESGVAGVRIVWDEGVLRRWDEDVGYWVEVGHEWIASLIMDLDGCWIGVGKGRKRMKVSAGMVDGVWQLIKAKRSREGWFAGRPPGVLVAGQEGAKRWVLEGVEEPRPDSRDTWAVVGGGVGGGQKWIEFVSWLSCGDESMVAVLQEWTGAVLFGMATKFEKALLLYGGGSNGKSVFLKVIRGLLPKEAVCSVNPNQLEEEYYRARLRGKVLNVVTELGRGRKKGGEGHEAFKAIISGDPIGAREPRGKVFDLVPICGHAFATNELPGVGDFSRGFWRKWKALPCEAEATPDMQVGYYERELLEEVGGVVEWAVEGVRRLEKVGRYTECVRGDVLGRLWRKDSDQVAEFLEDWEMLNGKVSVTFSLMEAYQSYLPWAASEGSGRLRRKKFKDRLEALIGPQKRINAKRVYHFERSED